MKIHNTFIMWPPDPSAETSLSALKKFGIELLLKYTVRHKNLVPSGVLDCNAISYEIPIDSTCKLLNFGG